MSPDPTRLPDGPDGADRRPAASVVTIVRDRPDHLAWLARGLVGCRPQPAELVVVDMASSRSPASVLDAELAGAVPWRLVELAGPGPGHPGRLPLAAARNLGAAHTRADLLIFLDVDCIPATDLVGAYVEALATWPGAIASAPVRYLREGWAHSPQPLSGAHLEAASAPHPTRPAPPAAVVDQRHELLWSLSMGVTRTVWRALGGFDEGFRGYGAEDTDLGFAARAGGVPMVWLSAGTAYHQWHPTEDPPVQHLGDIVDNARRFHRKWQRWPMSGWLAAFAERGLIRWAPDRGILEVCVDG